jgi:outer membrane cobalamin receptor
MHRPAVRFLFFSFVTLFFVTTSESTASAAGAITGRVVDQDGRPLAGALVLVSSEGIPLRSVTTGDNGDFEIAPTNGERLVLRVAMQGFRAETITVDAHEGTRDVGTITMAIGALSESVVVSASQVELPLTQVTSSVSVITGAELETRQIHTVADALQTVPGLTVVRTGGIGSIASIFPRGGESNYTLVLIDGVPANAFGGDFDFSQLTTANIDRIEIARGPQSALYGANAIGAVVRIVTRSGGQPSAQLTAETGQFGTSHIGASTAGRQGDFEWGGFVERLVSDGMNGERSAAGQTIGNDDYDRKSGGLSAGWRRNDAWVRSDVRQSNDERGFPGPFGSNPIGAYEGIDTVARGKNDRTLASIALSLPVAPRVRAQALTGYSAIDSDFTSQFGGSESFSHRWMGRAQIDAGLGHGLDMSAGIEVQRERAGSTFITGASFQKIPVKRSTAGYFGEARWNARDRMFVNAGVRMEDIRRERIEESPTQFSPRPVLPTDTVVSVNPRVGAAWLVRTGGGTYTKLRGGVGTGIRPPDGFELAFTDNPGLSPERSVSGEAGIDHAFAGGRGLVEATAFVNKYDDLIVAVGSFSGSSRYRTDNISNARARGLELALTLRARIGGRRSVDLSGRAGYTFLATEILAVDQNNAAPPPFVVGQNLLRRPPHQFFADGSVAAGRIMVFLRGGGRSRVLDVEPSFGTFGGLFDAPGYQVWQIGGSWRIAKSVEAVGRVENVFDRSYEEAFGFPAPGRRATVGLRIAAGR